jgi:hypothetical protein
VKTTIAFYLVILYTLAVCKPVLPLIQDEMAHIFWKAQHIATVHHHHGNHHAEKEIATAHSEEKDQHPATSKTSEPVSIHVIVQSSYSSPNRFIQKQKFSIPISNTRTIFLDKQYPPPKSC